MPIYEYVCQKCQAQIDVFQKMNDPAPEKCETCGAEGSMNRVVSRTSFILKGGGWYSDLYSSKKKDGTKAEGTAEPKAEASPSPNGKETSTRNGAVQSGSEAPKSTETPAASPASSKTPSTSAK